METGHGNYRRWILEMVLVTGLFAVISVFILRIYVTADRLQGEAVAVSTATVRTQSILEYAAANGVSAAAEYFGMQKKDEAYVLYFDKQWQMTGEKSVNRSTDPVKYAIVMREIRTQDGLVYAQVCAGDIGQENRMLSGGETQEETSDSEYLCKLRTCVRGEGWIGRIH